MEQDSWRLDKDAEDAKTLILVALIIQVILTVLVVVYYLAAFSFILSPSLAPPGTTTTPVFPLLSIIIGLSVSFLAIGILWCVLDYFLLYRRIVDGKIEETDTASLVLGILQLIFGGLISGILILIAHGKITSSINHKAWMRQRGQEN